MREQLGENIRGDISEIKSFSSKGEFVLILLKVAKDKDLNIEKIKKRIKELMEKCINEEKRFQKKSEMSLN